MIPIDKLRALDEATLIALYKAIVSVVKEKRRDANLEARYKFKCGDVVMFTGRSGLKIKGKIESIKLTKAHVRPLDGGATWNVPMHLLALVPDANIPVTTSNIQF